MVSFHSHVFYHQRLANHHPIGPVFDGLNPEVPPTKIRKYPTKIDRYLVGELFLVAGDWNILEPWNFI